MSGNGNQVPMPPNQRGPGSYPRTSTPQRAECYHPSGSTGPAYITAASPGTSQAPPAAMRVQTAQQPPAPQQTQQDLAKNAMSHNYVAQNQAAQARQQFPNYPYRPTQHASRATAHPRQQQQFIPGAAAGNPSLVYQALMTFPSTPHMSMPPQTYGHSQPRSQQQYYQFIPQFINYNSNPNPSPNFFAYPSNSQQLPASGLNHNGPGRSNAAPHVPQGAPANPNVSTAPIPHLQQTPGHMHQNMHGMRNKRPPSHRVPIIHPVTNQDILSEIISNDSNQYNTSSDSSERQTPQPESSREIVEDFARRVSEAANQPSASETNNKSFLSKNVDAPAATVSPPTCTLQSQTNAISSISNNNVVKSDNILSVNESKNLGPDVAVESSETPVVSAISDSPVIVPKMCPTNKKQLQKNSEQPIVVDTNKNISSNNKIQKQNKSKPVVPQVEDEKSTEIVTISTPLPALNMTPQPQRIREPRERGKSEDKDKAKDTQAMPSKLKAPVTPVAISSVDSLPVVINSPTSQSNQTELPNKPIVPVKPIASIECVKETIHEQSKPSELTETKVIPVTTLTATELLSASIEAVAAKAIKDLPSEDTDLEHTEVSIVSEAQAKLNQSLTACNRVNQTELKMKDTAVTNKNLDPDTANGNTTDTASNNNDNSKEDINRNEKSSKSVKNVDNQKAINKSDLQTKEMESYENGKDETDKISNVDQETFITEDSGEKASSPSPTTPLVFVPKYKYSDDQWSPMNKTGKKYYDLDLLKQIKDDPLCKNKPDLPLPEACKIMRALPIEPLSFNLQSASSRSISDALLPGFVKSAGGISRNTPRDAKKDSRTMMPGGKGSVKLSPSPSGSSPHKHNVIHVSLSLREDVKLNETENAWKPTRFKRDNVTEEDFRTQDMYKKFRGILNKLTPQKFDTLLDKVKELEINNQKRLEGVIDLVFEKAIEEPNFSEAYAALCGKLSTLKVPADNASNSEQCVNFRGLIISKCQAQFITNKVDDQVLKIETDLAECNEPTKKKELRALLEEENRRVRMRSVGNVRFIGELFKLEMLTPRIMVYCMNYLIDKCEEEKLECLCKLLTTIGQLLENMVKDNLDIIFKKMMDIVDRKNSRISSRVRFMLQDVIELRNRKWVVKSVVDLQPKMMDQIQKEAEQQHRQTELLISSMGNSYRRDDGGRGKRGGDGRRQSQNAFTDNAWKNTRNNYSVDTSKFKVVANKNLDNIKLAPQKSQWTHGSSTKSAPSTNLLISLPTTTNNKYSVLENVQTDPTSITEKDMNPGYHSKGASIERSTFNSRGDFSSSSTNSKSGSMGVPRPMPSSHSVSTTPTAPSPPVTPVPAEPPTSSSPMPQESLTDQQKKLVKATINQSLISPDDNDLADEFRHRFKPEHHSAIITEILNVALEKPAKQIINIAKSLLHLITTNTISATHLTTGLSNILEFAPDLYIDIPMLYDYLTIIIVPQIENKHITFEKVLQVSENIIAENQGHLILKSLIIGLKSSMGPSFVKSKWQESGLHLNQWMSEDQVAKFVEDNKFEFLENGGAVIEETKKLVTPAETQSKLLQLMNADENCECIRGWVQDNLGKGSNEDWFMKSLIKAICEHSLFGPEGRGVPHFNQDRMNKYSSLISEFGETKQAREASCLFGIQQLIHQLEHPQGLTLDIFQYLHEQYIISVEGFIAWEESELQPEGKGVMMKALTSFFTNIKEADNDDSCSED